MSSPTQSRAPKTSPERERRVFYLLPSLASSLILCASSLLSPSCDSQSPRVSPEAAFLTRAGRFSEARSELRPFAADTASPDVVLDNLRLAIAALHDGAFFESRSALARAYPYLVTGTVNAPDRQNAAVFSYEGRTVWKGEPFEQAMAWYYQSLVPMIEGDWENAGAAARNMLFTLVDFAGAPTIDAAMRAAESPEWFDEHADRVESDLVLGHIMIAIAENGQARPADAAEHLDAAAKLCPDLVPLLDTLRDASSYNTLIFIEAGPGPVKIPHGDHGEYFTFESEPLPAPLPLREGSEGGLDSQPISALIVADLARDNYATISLPNRLDLVDTTALAQHPRWWSLRSLRETKRNIGSALSLAGTGAVIYGVTSKDANSSDKALLAGLAAIFAGEALASSSAADLRSLDVLPRTIYLLPLKLDPGPHALRISIPGTNLSAVRHFIMPGLDSPAVYTIRLDDNDALSPLPIREGSGGGLDSQSVQTSAPPIIHPNDVTGPIPGAFPYILGGTCVCTPTQDVLDVYHASGFLTDLTLEDLLDLYRAEGIVFRPRPLRRENAPTWRHILEGGRLLYTPVPGSAGFERLTFRTAPPYQPRSDLVRAAAARLRSTNNEHHQ